MTSDALCRSILVRRFGFALVAALVVLCGAIDPVNAAGAAPVAGTASAGTPYVADGKGKTDADVLKIDAEFSHIKYLITAGGDAGLIKLGFMQTADLTGPDNELELARGQFRDGRLTREKFLLTARQRLVKRQAAVDAALKGDKPKCEEYLRQDPYLQVHYFGALLRLALDQLRLPLKLSEQTSGWIGSHEFDLEKERNERTYERNRGKTDLPPARDQAWVEQMKQERVGHAMKALSVPQREEVVKAWKILFPKGPAAPSTDDAAYADVDKKAPEAPVKPKTKTPATPDGAKPVGTKPDSASTGPAVAGSQPTDVPDKTDPGAGGSSAGSKDLISLVDAIKDAPSGEWTAGAGKGVKNKAGSDPQKEPAKLAVPAKLTGSYELTFTLNRVEGQNALCVLFPVGSGEAQLWLGSGNKGQEGEVAYIQSTGSTGGGKKQPIGHDKVHRLRLRIEVKGDDASVDVWMDTLPLLKWNGPAKKLRAQNQWALPKAASLGFSVEPTTSYEINEVHLHPFGGGTIEKK